MEKLNINILLCEKCEDKLQSIYNIFDTIKLDAKKSASFTIVTQINGFEVTFNRLGLFYFIKKHNLNGKNAYKYLGRTLIEKIEGAKKISTGENQLSSKENSIQEITQTYLNNVSFLDIGQYEIQVFLYKDDDIPQDKDNLTLEEKKALRKDDHLVALCDFEAI